MGKSKGYYYIRKRAKSWRVYHEFWRSGVRSQVQVPASNWPLLGLQASMSVEQARAAVASYNKLAAANGLNKSDLLAQKRAVELETRDQLLFPAELVREFVERFKAASDGSARFKTRMLRCFEILQIFCVELRLQPHDYEHEIDRISGYLKQQKYSLSYCQDVLYMLNKWGAFASRKLGKYYEPVPKLRLKTQAAIAAQAIGKRGVRKTSLPITAELLTKLSQHLRGAGETEQQRLNWVQASFYFGLRPSEVDSVLDAPMIELHDGVTVLCVQQTKIAVIHEYEREKRIPVLLEEQVQVLQLLRAQKAKRPPLGWLQRHCNDLSFKGYYDLYAGRKGFTDFMMAEGQSLEHISFWMGHKSLATTRKAYKDRTRVHFVPTTLTKKLKAG